MYPLIESIKVKEGKMCLLSYHEDRMIQSLIGVYGLDKHPVDFQMIAEKVSTLGSKELFKLRITYGEKEFSYSIEPYKIKPITSLVILDADSLDYEYKYADRAELQELYHQRGEYDDILICRNGAITDSYYCNVAFEKDGVWYTPDTPLLKGTKRAYLLEQGLIKEEELYIEDIPDMSRIRLFNAMVEFGEIELDVNGIHIS